MIPNSIDDTATLLRQHNYIPDHSLSTAVFLALKMNRPLFLEGEAGVGKTEIAKVLAKILGTELIRLQCYEGLDISEAVYEWNYSKQILEIRLAETGNTVDRSMLKNKIFSDEFLIKRPILRSLETGPAQRPPVLLIDELDRSDEPFEAFLLEILSEFQVTIPELGTIKADKPPIVVITSNRTREIHDAVKRRCLYHWVGYPSAEQELDILREKAGDLSERLSRQIVDHVQTLREKDLFKKPGTAETLDWAEAIQALNQTEISAPIIESTLGVLLKYQDDIEKVSSNGN